MVFDGQKGKSSITSKLKQKTQPKEWYWNTMFFFLEKIRMGYSLNTKAIN